MLRLRHILPPRRDLARQDGISLIVVLALLTMTSVLITAVFTAAQGEIRQTSVNTAQKEAYYAAIAGINNYAYHLTQDPNYLTYCTSPPTANAALNQYYKTSAGESSGLIKGHELKTVTVPGDPNEKYAIQLVPAKSAPANQFSCEKENHVVESMIERSSENEAATGSFRVESTGFAKAPGRTNPIERTVIANFRNIGFTSFVYYTEYETEPPVIYTTRTEAEQEKCRAPYGESPEPTRPSYCLNVYFISKDHIKGPMHTEDHVAVCGKPEFGRNKRDRIEFGTSVKGDKGYSLEGTSSCAEGANPVFVGTEILPSEVPSIKPPPSNTELELITKAESGEPYHFTGRTEIALEGEQMTVTLESGTTKVMSYPPSGVIYVSNGTCSYTFTPFNPSYTADKGCGDVYVHGSYTKSLTIGSQNDVIINGAVTTPNTGGESPQPTTHALLGLIANNFVRVYHPVKNWSESFGGTSCENATGSLSKLEIWAAILSVKQSFIVDNYNCGASLSTLTIHGALAQIFRGPVGTFGSTSTGYEKSYEYDERLRAAEPPHFLSPVEASWHIQRETLAPTPEW
jgi:Tfp pilus assembly protein PilX